MIFSFPNKLITGIQAATATPTVLREVSSFNLVMFESVFLLVICNISRSVDRDFLFFNDYYVVIWHLESASDALDLMEMMCVLQMFFY